MKDTVIYINVLINYCVIVDYVIHMIFKSSSTIYEHIFAVQINSDTDGLSQTIFVRFICTITKFVHYLQKK